MENHEYKLNLSLSPISKEEVLDIEHDLLCEIYNSENTIE